MSHHGKKGYPHTAQIMVHRRKQAEEAHEAYNKLSTQEKLDRLPEGGAKKQRAKLEALLLKEKEPKQTAKAETNKQPENKKDKEK